MTLQIDDWVFEIDSDRTKEHSSFALRSHCSCGYCENYYRAADQAYPNLRGFLDRFFLELEGPSEMYPIEPTLCLLGYKVFGRIIRVGNGPIMIDGIPVMGEILDEDTFKLEVGEMVLPWILEEDMDEVISPANEPEFLDKMYRILLSRSSGFICS